MIVFQYSNFNIIFPPRSPVYLHVNSTLCLDIANKQNGYSQYLRGTSVIFYLASSGPSRDALEIFFYELVCFQVLL